jgi:hypothetical protein
VTRHFCTYFDHRFLTRGLALWESLSAHCKDFQLWVLCLSDLCYEVLDKLSLPRIQLIRMAEFESRYPELLAVKSTRTFVEYYFTCSPFLVWDILQLPNMKEVTYLDADLFFFASPEPILQTTQGASIVLSPHRYPAHWKQDCEKYGIYNVGWVGFRNDASAHLCLKWWQEQCVEWCYAHVEPGRYGDQKYLDDWPDRFQGVHILAHKGVNAAAWNICRHTIIKHDDGIFVDEDQLICYHFHHFKLHGRWLLETDAKAWPLRLTRIIKQGIFAPYLRSLASQERRIADVGYFGIDTKLASARQEGSSTRRNRIRYWREVLRAAQNGNLLLRFNHQPL